MEIEINAAFDVYRSMYYEGTESEVTPGGGGGAAIGSVYLWDLDEGFAGVVLLKKETGGNKGRGNSKAAWDSIHVFEVDERSARGSTGGAEHKPLQTDEYGYSAFPEWIGRAGGVESR